MKGLTEKINYKEETDVIFNGIRYKNYMREYTEIEKITEK